jgi:3-hydroxymyristoyl/3-hydroxydecanoyl-(acyl carrier protein) dehydratase
MRFLYYDRVISIEKGRSIVGTKAFPLSEEFLRRHFTRKAIVPGVICLEAMAQLLGWLIIYSHDFKLSAIMSLVEGVRVPAGLRPGFSAEIHAELLSTSRRDSLGKARILVGGEEVASVERLIFSHVPNVDRSELIARFSYYSGISPESLMDKS